MRTRGTSPFGFFIALLLLGLLMAGLFLFFGLMLRLLYFVGPVLLVIAVVMDYKTVTNYLGGILSLIKRSPLRGIAALLLSIIGYPIVAVFLLGRILLFRRINRYQREMQQRTEGEATDYEELETKPLPPVSQWSVRGRESDLV